MIHTFFFLRTGSRPFWFRLSVKTPSDWSLRFKSVKSNTGHFRWSFWTKALVFRSVGGDEWDLSMLPRARRASWTWFWFILSVLYLLSFFNRPNLFTVIRRMSCCCFACIELLAEAAACSSLIFRCLLSSCSMSSSMALTQHWFWAATTSKGVSRGARSKTGPKIIAWNGFQNDIEKFES